MNSSHLVRLAMIERHAYVSRDAIINSVLEEYDMSPADFAFYNKKTADSVVDLDSQVTEDNASAVNKYVSDFIDQLPEDSEDDVEEGYSRGIDEITDEVQDVKDVLDEIDDSDDNIQVVAKLIDMVMELLKLRGDGKEVKTASKEYVKNIACKYVNLAAEILADEWQNMPSGRQRKKNPDYKGPGTQKYVYRDPPKEESKSKESPTESPTFKEPEEKFDPTNMIIDMGKGNKIPFTKLPEHMQKQLMEQWKSAPTKGTPPSEKKETPKTETPKETPAPKSRRTRKPKPVVPKTEAPAIPTTEVPKTEAPNTEEPKETPAPKSRRTRKPKLVVPKTEAPPAGPSPADHLRTEAPKQEVPKTEVSKVPVSEVKKVKPLSKEKPTWFDKPLDKASKEELSAKHFTSVPKDAKIDDDSIFVSLKSGKSFRFGDFPKVMQDKIKSKVSEGRMMKVPSASPAKSKNVEVIPPKKLDEVMKSKSKPSLLKSLGKAVGNAVKHVKKNSKKVVKSIVNDAVKSKSTVRDTIKNLINNVLSGYQEGVAASTYSASISRVAGEFVIIAQLSADEQDKVVESVIQKMKEKGKEVVEETGDISEESAPVSEGQGEDIGDDELVLASIREAAQGLQMNRKDKDLMSDTGGGSYKKREPKQRPPRDDVRKPFSVKHKKPEQLDKDVDVDEDKIFSSLSDRIAKDVLSAVGVDI